MKRSSLLTLSFVKIWRTLGAEFTIGCVLAGTFFGPAIANAQLFAHRTLIAVPVDDSTQSPGLMTSISYLLDFERGYGSAGDDRAYGIRFAGTFELWRLTPRTAVLMSTADELAANSLKDNGFNPRGITWELSIGIAHRFDAFTAQLDYGHYCKHAIDAADPPGPEHQLDDYVATQRTASVWGPRLRLISRPVQAGKRVKLRASVAGERFQNQWDGRTPFEPDATAQGTSSWSDAKASTFGAIRLDVQATRAANVYVRASGRQVYFGEGPATRRATVTRTNYRAELGVLARGRGGAFELYGALENVFDDMGTTTPRPSRAIGAGLRLSNLRYF